MPTDFPPTEIPAGWFTILEALREHHVQFVIAGAAADAVVQEDPLDAAGLVVAPAPYRRNLERVSRALATLAPHHRDGEDDRSTPFSVAQVANHPALRWRLHAAGVALDVIGSAVGDGEFSIRLWRTRPIELTYGSRSLVAEVELAPRTRVA
jgi:hypothetical protein